MAKKKRATTKKKEENSRGIGYDEALVDKLIEQGIDAEDAREQARIVPK